MNSSLKLKIEHSLMHCVFFMVIFGLGYWIWPLENKTFNEYAMYVGVLILSTFGFNIWKQNWTFRYLDDKNKP